MIFLRKKKLISYCVINWDLKFMEFLPALCIMCLDMLCHKWLFIIMQELRCYAIDIWLNKNSKIMKGNNCKRGSKLDSQVGKHLTACQVLFRCILMKNGKAIQYWDLSFLAQSWCLNELFSNLFSIHGFSYTSLLHITNFYQMITDIFIILNLPFMALSLFKLTSYLLWLFFPFLF